MNGNGATPPSPTTATCDCGASMRHDPTADGYFCEWCIGPERRCRCGAMFLDQDGHHLCFVCRFAGLACGCGVCRMPKAAFERFHAELRMQRRSAGGTERPLSPAVYKAVVASGPCVYCGGASAHADHVRPLARGGADHAGNLVPACKDCNQDKGDKLLTEWEPARVQRAITHSPVVLVEYAGLTGRPVTDLREERDG